MKRMLFCIILLFSSMCLSVSVIAAEKTTAYNKLMNTIVSKYEMSEINLYILTDASGNEWTAGFAPNGNIVYFSTLVDNYETACALANKLSGGIEEKFYQYTIPFMRHPELPRMYDVVIPVYKDIKVDIICARPVNLYPSGEKLIDSFSINQSSETDVIMFSTRTTASFKTIITSGGLQAGHMWGQDWYSEEEEAAWETNEGSSSAILDIYTDVNRDDYANYLLNKNQTDPSKIIDNMPSDIVVTQPRTVTIDESKLAEEYNTKSEPVDFLKLTEEHIKRQLAEQNR